MAKAHINRKELKRLKLKGQHRVAIETANYIRTIAETVTDNRTLRTMLMQEPNVEKRRLLFDFMVPHLKFKNPEFPSLIEPSRIILP